MTNEAAGILRKAKELIETKGWSKGAFARNYAGQMVNPLDESACEFCLLGAMHAASRVPLHDVTDDIPGLSELAEAIGDDIADWQDEPGRIKFDALAKLDLAIALAEAGK